MRPTIRLGRWPRILCVLLCAAAVLVAARLTWERHEADLADRTVSLAVVLGEVDDLADRLGVDPQTLLDRLRASGIQGILAKERSTADLDEVIVAGRGAVTAAAGITGAGPLLDDVARGLAGHPGLKTVLLGPVSRLEDLAGVLAAKGAGAVVLTRDPEGRPTSLGSSLAVPDLDELGLGFDLQRLDALRQDGFRIYLQYRALPGGAGGPAAGEPDLAGLFAPTAALGVPIVFFNDAELPGYPGRLGEVAAALDSAGAAAGMIEGFEQRGLAALARDLDDRVIKLHAIQPAELPALSFSREVERYRLAVAERNVRVLLVRLHEGSDPEADLDRTLRVVEAVRGQLAGAGFRFGDPVPASPRPAGAAAQVLMALGVAAALVLAADLAGLTIPGLLLAGLWTAGFSVLLWAGPGLQVLRVGALGAAVVFPVLALLLVARREGRSFGAALAAYGAAGLVSAAGGLFQVAFLSHPAFLQRLALYLGTKLSLSLPALAVGLAVAWRFGHLDRLRALRGRSRRLLAAAVPVPWVLAGVAVAVIGFFVLTRSGNQPLVMPSALELQVRQLLTDWLGVRPRFKEFAFGHVFLMLALVLGAGRGLSPVLFMLAAVGQMSIVNTFAHVHSPVLVMVIRWLYGLAAGAVLSGLLYLALGRLRPAVPAAPAARSPENAEGSPP